MTNPQELLERLEARCVLIRLPGSSGYQMTDTPDEDCTEAAAFIRSLMEENGRLKADAARYRHLKEHCSSHYPMTWEQPAEWSIGWEFQQNTPAEAFGDFDTWIDRDIERQAVLDAENPDEADAPSPPQVTDNLL